MEGRFVDNGDGTVTDNCTGLMWAKNSTPTSYHWQAALQYCDALDFAGHTDWRPPNIMELPMALSRSDPPLLTKSNPPERSTRRRDGIFFLSKEELPIVKA